MNTKENKIGPAIVISGIKLLYDFSVHNFYSLQLVLENMQFLLKKYLPEDSISLYVSELYNDELSTLVFFSTDNSIKKVRYIDQKMEQFFYT